MKRLFLFELLATCIALACSARAADQLTPTPFDWPTFLSLPHDRQVERIVAAFAARDASLNNVSYKLRETHVNINRTTGGRRFMYKGDYELRRVANKLWMRQTNHEFYDPKADVRDLTLFTWDGNTGRGMLLVNGSNPLPEPHCWTQPEEHEAFRTHKFGLLLFFRMDMDFESNTPARWLHNALAKGETIQISDDERDGARLLRVAVIEGKWVRHFLIDPARGFMMLKAQTSYDRDWGASTLEVLTSNQFAGIWISTKAVGLSGNYKGDERPETMYEVEDFRIGQVKDSDVELTFPADVKIIAGKTRMEQALAIRRQVELEMVRVNPPPGPPDTLAAATRAAAAPPPHAAQPASSHPRLPAILTAAATVTALLLVLRIRKNCARGPRR
jgi:hypothetical protein